jgi:phosphatidylserine decarboxylase
VSASGPPLLVRLLPRRLVSRTAGFLGRRRAPGFALRPILRWYARRFGVDLAEAAHPLESYRSFLAFFTRPLRAGARPMPDDPLAIVSPADGRAYRTGTVEAGTVLQAKGVPYALADLLGSAEDAARFEGGTYHVVYLSPGDYHRFHWPLSGHVDTVRHLPGDLWPVNERAVRGVRGLFVRNERVALLGRTGCGGAFAFVPVGALNVGSIRLAFHDVRTNRWRRGAPRTWTVDARGRRGDELGRFDFGSSIVLVLSPEAGRLDALEAGARLCVGQPIGRLSEA